MTTSAIAQLVSWLCGALALSAYLRSTLGIRKLTRVRRSLEERMEQAARDRAFVLWATHTMLTVTSTDGTVFASSIHQLADAAYEDRVWEKPFATALWYGTPDMIDRYRGELREEGRG